MLRSTLQRVGPVLRIIDNYSGRSNNVRHVDTSSLPQFTAKEEAVIGINESREVFRRNFRDFEKIGGFNDVPVQFLRFPKSSFGNINEYSQEASVKAILCDC
jgi:hypothetical protein